MPYGDPGGYGRPILPGMVNQPPGYSIQPLPGTPGYVPEGLERMDQSMFDPMAPMFAPQQKKRAMQKAKKKRIGGRRGGGGPPDVQDFLAKLAMMNQGQGQGQGFF